MDLTDDVFGKSNRKMDLTDRLKIEHNRLMGLTGRFQNDRDTDNSVDLTDAFEN